MELEMDIEDLLNKRKLESDRIEFKTGGRILMISTIVSVHLQMIIIMMAAVVLL